MVGWDPAKRGWNDKKAGHLSLDRARDGTKLSKPKLRTRIDNETSKMKARCLAGWLCRSVKMNQEESRQVGERKTEPRMCGGDQHTYSLAVPESSAFSTNRLDRAIHAPRD